MEGIAIPPAFMSYVPGAILALGSIALGLQASLCVRYVFGRWRLKSWHNKALTLDWSTFLVALAELQHRFNWVDRFLYSSGQALGLTNGKFRIEYTTEWIRDEEESLFRHAFARFATASLLIFGLGGTFWYFIHLVSNSGLISALEQLTTGTGEQTGAYLALSKAFLAALDGFGQAFKASLAGLAATIALSFSNQLFVERSRAKFVHAWSTAAHEWEQRMLDAKKYAEAAETVPDAQRPSPYEPLAAEVTGPEVVKTLSAVNAALNDAAQTQERWQKLVDALHESRDFHLHAITAITKAGDEQRIATQTLIDHLVLQMKSEIIPGLVNEIKVINAAKLEHFKEAEAKLADHFKAAEQTWENKLDQTLASFAERSKEVTSAAQQEVAATRSEALTAGERVAEAIRGETQQALVALQEMLSIASKRQAEIAASAQLAATSAQKELAATRSEALTAGERVAVAIRGETQQALVAFQDLLNLATKSQTELSSSTIQVQELHGELRLLMKEDKEALSSYMRELKQSLDAWKKAPKAIEGSLTELATATSELTNAMQQAAKMPSRWKEEIDQLSTLLREGYNYRRQASLWHQVGSKTSTIWERIVSYVRDPKK